jgi:hypothetical protein
MREEGGGWVSEGRRRDEGGTMEGMRERRGRDEGGMKWTQQQMKVNGGRRESRGRDEGGTRKGGRPLKPIVLIIFQGIP